MALGPRLPRREQVRNAAEGKLPTILSAVVEPLLQRVLGGEIFLGRVMHDRGRREADPLPLQAALDAPAQDCRPLGLELLSQSRVALGRRNLHRERHQQQAPAHGLVHAGQPRLVVAADEQLETSARSRRSPGA